MYEGLIVWTIIGAIAGGYLYFLPGVIAGYKKHKYRTAITIINLFTGWTIVGWIGLLIWVLMPENQIKIDYTEQLMRLSELKNSGAITENEFEKEKAKLLNFDK